MPNYCRLKERFDANWPSHLHTTEHFSWKWTEFSVHLTGLPLPPLPHSPFKKWIDGLPARKTRKVVELCIQFWRRGRRWLANQKYFDPKLASRRCRKCRVRSRQSTSGNVSNRRGIASNKFRCSVATPPPVTTPVTLLCRGSSGPRRRGPDHCGTGPDATRKHPTLPRRSEKPQKSPAAANPFYLLNE